MRRMTASRPRRTRGGSYLMCSTKLPGAVSVTVSTVPDTSTGSRTPGDRSSKMNFVPTGTDFLVSMRTPPRPTLLVSSPSSDSGVL